MDNKYHVFVSYCRRNFDEVNAFLRQLHSSIPQLRCWFDMTGIESGDEFTEKIVAAIDNSDYVLFMVSDEAMAAKWTKKEVMYAKVTGKRVIPVLLNGAAIKGWFLFEFGLIDSIDTTDAKQVNKLISNLCSWTGLGNTDQADTKNNLSTSNTDDISLEKANQLYNAKDYEAAVNIYRTLANEGDAKGQYNLGLCYASGRGVEQDYTQAIKWYWKAAEQGNPSAQFNLGFCYENGYGVKQDYLQAIQWYQKAAEQGDLSARCSLGLCIQKWANRQI